MPIYSLGSNGCGQLGIGHEEDTAIPTLVNLPAELRHTAITSIRAGGNHTLLLTSTSRIYSTGDNSNGRCAIQSPQSTTFIKSHVSNIKLCAATWEASVFVENSGSILVCGTGLKGELGLGTSITTASSPSYISNFPPRDTEVVDLAACMGHVVAVLSNGEVWGWGNGQQDQLGEPAEVVWQPRQIKGLRFNAARVVCGKDFTAVFGSPDEGNVAIFGVKKRDRFGIKAGIPDDLHGRNDVQATWGGVYIIKYDGNLTAWGRDDHGQLPLQSLPKIKAISAGSEHVLALTADKTVLAWGWGEHGNCGQPVDEQKDVKGRWNALEFDGNPVAVGGGCATSWIVTTEKQG